MSQTTEQDKTWEKEQNKMAISNLPDKEFKGMVIKMLTKLRTEMEEHNENFSKERKYKKEPIIAGEYDN